jgi:ribosomal protein L22
MANLKDLDHKSISEMSTDEALELLRQTRLSRRTPVKKVSNKKTKAKKKVVKSKQISKDQAAELLKLLGGN